MLAARDKPILRNFESLRTLRYGDKPIILSGFAKITLSRFSSLCCSGVGIVPKKSGKLRLIHHLSAPAGVSVNDGIPKDLYSLQYVTIDNAINMILCLGRGTLLAKIDIHNAFRLCPVRPEDQPLLGIYWRQQYYYDLVLPFGVRSAPFIFNQVADAFEWICREEVGISDLIHLLDDFLTAGPPASDICSRRLEIILAACTYLGIPVAEEKTEASTTSLTFLGIEPVRQTEFCRLGRRGRSHIHAPLVGCHSCRTRATLPHYSQPVMPRRLGVVALPLGHLERAVVFPPAWLVTSPSHASLYRADASETLGYGAFFGGRWFSGTWLPDQQACCITYKELYPIALACSTWGHEWSSLRVEFHSDNQAIVSSLHKWSCRCSNAMSLLRRLFLVCALQNFNVSASYVECVSDGIADSLSRQDFGRFRTLAPQSAAIPDTARPLPNIPREPSLAPCTSTHSNH